jgi:uncharacterized protein (TIGR02284 family)
MRNDKEVFNEARNERESLDNDEVISRLNELIETCKDGQEGFKSAAEGVENSELKKLFYEYSQQRSQFVGELQEAVRLAGGDPEKSGSVAAALHRGWINIKSVVTGKDEEAIISECERGEDSAVSTYEDILQKGLSQDIAPVVERQYHLIKAAHDRVKVLRDTGIAKDATA